MDRIKDPILFDLLYPVILDGIKKVVAVYKERIIYRPSYFQYPEIRYWPNGLPNISKATFGNSPLVKYEAYFESYDKETPPKVILKELTGYKEVHTYLCENEDYNRIYGYPGKEEEWEPELRLIEININSHIKGLVAKALHTWGEDVSLSKENFLEIYFPIENSIYFKELPVVFYIPILFLNFDVDIFRFNDSISLVKMDEKHHLSRINVITYSENVSDTVISAATHALVLENFRMVNGNKYINSNSLSNINSFPLEEINYFFNALRMVIDHPTGYAQVLSKPINWTYAYKADLIAFHGASTRAYPYEFNQHYWLEPSIPIVSSEELKSIAAIYKGLKGQENKKIQLACKRLESCFLRKDERDIIIDAVIGLETLLSDSDKGELTHKLSMRISFLLQMSSLKQSKLEIFKNMKHIYSYRSLIVHGDANAEKKRVIKRDNQEPISTTELAVTYLKECIMIMINNAEYLNAKMIDEKIILSN